MKRGFTLLELTLTIAMLVILTAVTFYAFRAVLLTWAGEETRAGAKTDLYRGTEAMSRQLVQAKGVDFLNNDEIRFTGPDDNHYIYYLYNRDDAYPPSFNRDRYELMEAALSGVSGNDLKTGTFSYGAGTVVITGVSAPGTSDLSVAGNIITIDLTATQGSETVRLRTQVRPRNI
jgi:prepilin-type N-terminal cleavage/methylation domain-containing protein